MPPVTQPQPQSLENGNRLISEHERRIQRSLSQLNVPEWYTKYSTSRSSSASNDPTYHHNHPQMTKTKSLAGGWSGLSNSGSKTSSLTSLQFTGRPLTCPRNGVSRDSLLSPTFTNSPSQSPCATRSSFSYGVPYRLSRFTSSRMSCGESPTSWSPSPSPSPMTTMNEIYSCPVSPSSATPTRSFKTPYMGWRSQEKLTSKLLYTNPVAERLASNFEGSSPSLKPKILQTKTTQTPRIVETVPKINGRKQNLWIESSFVGKKPEVVNQNQNIFQFNDSLLNSHLEEVFEDEVF